MERKNIILIISALLIIICFVFMFKGNKTNNAQKTDGTVDIEVNYNEVVDETTGEKYYQIYNKETGEEMTNVTDEAMLQMYIDNPDFVGVEHEENSNQPREYNEDGSVREITE